MPDKNTITSIQIETTSRCNLQCLTCLKPVFGKDWIERDMNRSLLSTIINQVPGKPTLHLQGWGEPLLHPETLSHIKQLKKAGFTVSFTTNGTIMDRHRAQSLILSGLDGITFSMAGSCQETHDKLRGSDSFRNLQTTINTLSMTRDEFRVNNPKIAVSYLLTPETIKELPAAISWCRKKKVNQLVTVFLTQAACRTQQQLQFLVPKEIPNEYRFLRVNCQLRALFGGMRLMLKTFCPTLTPICEKNPLNSLFINAAGDVSPCVFLCPPTDREISWIYNDKRYLKPPLIFGNISREPLADIWDQPEYRAFRKKFRERAEYHDRSLSDIGYSFAGSEKLETAVRDIERYFASHPVPGHCACCAKVDGF